MKIHSILMSVLCVIAMSGTAVAAQESTDLTGVWQLAERVCSSGAPVLDQFLPGRDVVEMTFQKNSFRAFSDINGCLVNSSGYYEVRGPYLTMDIIRQVSSCSRDRGTGRQTYNFTQRGDDLRVDIGPVNGGPCPSGDIYSLSYWRL